MPTRRRNEATSFTRNSQLVIMDTIDQVLSSDSFVVLRHIDGPGNCQSVLDQRRGYSDYPLNRDIASFSHVVLLTITGCCREICIEVGVTKTPACGCEIKPPVGGWIRDTLSSSL